MTAKIPIAVIGTGAMGTNHARVLSVLEPADLVGVVDADPARAARVAETYGCPAFSRIEEIVGKAEAAVVAVPTNRHAEVGTYLMDQGIHCLVEKPLAHTESDCRALVDAARRNGVALGVGHVERYNPAVQQLIRILAMDYRVHAVDVKRLSWVKDRDLGVDVISDLMVHDLDILRTIAGDGIENLAGTVLDRPSGSGDYAQVSMVLGGQTVATVAASRMTHTKIRRMEVTTDRGFFVLDYNDQQLFIHHQISDDQTFQMPIGGDHYRLDVAVERVFVRPAEPLMMELVDFLGAVAEGRAPEVDGAQGMAAMRMVWKVGEALEHRTV